MADGGRMNISVIGLGKLGCPFATWVASKGHDVIGVDVLPETVEKVNDGIPPVSEPGLSTLLAETISSGNLTATIDIQRAVLATDITFIVVPTPSNPDGDFSIAFVRGVAESIGLALKEKDIYHLVVIVSTVMPGHTQRIVTLLEDLSNKNCGPHFGVCYNPEFIALGSVLQDLDYPDFILVGESDSRAGGTLDNFYARCQSTYLPHDPPVMYRTNFVNAEIAKLALNCYVTMKISYANMLARLCEHLPGADVDEVTSAIGLDSRIGSKYLKGGTPFGGPCFPRDNRAFTEIRFPKPPSILWDLPVATRQENNQMKLHIFDKVIEYSRPGDVVGILGMAYKPGTSITEESLGVALEKFLRADDRCKVMTWDPLAECTDSLSDTLAHADVVVVTLPFKELENVTFQGQIVIDCWRVVDKDQLGKYTTYVPIGRYHK